jgi:nicotinamide phosphoribosyltransferase
MLDKNIILNVDSYKASHFLQYPPGTEYVNSYIESRGGRYNRTLFIGPQAFIKKYLVECEPLRQKEVDDAEGFFKDHGLPFNRFGWDYIVNKKNGRLPLEIWAAPEGSIIPTNNVLVQVRNTDPLCFWLTSYIETSLLRSVWYPTTVATISWMCKKSIMDSLKRTSDSDINEEIKFKLHDFGARGCSSLETAGIGGSAHLINFFGTDTIEGCLHAWKYYDAKLPVAYSISAAEHSTICSWGREGETDAYRNMIDKFKEQGIMAIVVDSYDIYETLRVKLGYQLKNEIKNSGARIVVRPDSGSPVKIVSDTIEILMEMFGFTVNSKGFKVLPDYLRVIQGDGVNHLSIIDILNEMENRKLSADNIAFGMGSGLLQNLDRDALRFAMKCSAIYRNNRWHEVYKDPVTDPGKKSKRGILSLRKNTDGYYTEVRECKFNNKIDSSDEGEQLQLVYKDGILMRNQTFDEIRQIANSYL